MTARPHAPAPFFALRAPLLPLDAWSSFARDLRAPACADAALDDARVAADRRAVCASLREAVAAPAVREALHLASPSLSDALDVWLASPDDPRAREVPVTLLRYLTRMATRATPFGLFAAHGLGALSDATHLALPDAASCARAARVDAQLLGAMVRACEGDPALREGLCFTTSNAAWSVGGHVRCAEGRVDPTTGARVNDTVSFRRSPPLAALLDDARVGAPFAALVRGVSAREDVDPEDARRFVDQLVDAGLLTSELAPSVTGADAAGALLARLTALAPEHPVTRALGELQGSLRAVAGSPPGHPRRWYDALDARLRGLPFAAEPGRVVQVDLRGPDGSTLSRAACAHIDDVVCALQSLTPAARDPTLERFCERFTARWEDASVPLTEALDEVHGVGYGEAAEGLTPLLDGLPFPRRDPPGALDARARWMLRRLHELAAAGRGVWVVDARDREALRVARAAPMPESYAVMCSLLGDPDRAGPDEVTLRFDGAYGPSASRLLGRFAASDERLAAHLRALLEEEEGLRPEARFVEVVHLPQGRLGNVITRPQLRPWELPYLGRGSAPTERQVTVDDLLVRVVKGRVVLASRRLGQEVLPRMSNAHTCGPGELPVYRFLCAVAADGAHATLRWRWGALGDNPFLPRVVLGRAVVSLATWNLPVERLLSLSACDGAARVRALRALRRAHDLPRVVSVQDADNVLPLDLENPVAVDALLRFVRGRAGLVALREVLLPTESPQARGPHGAHAHELVVPFVRRARAVAPAPRALPATCAARFAPGSDRLYAKIYTGALAADEVLAQGVAPWVASLRAEGVLRGWFFVRYADPEEHLRVRVEGDPAVLWGRALPGLHAALAPWIDDGTVARLTVDTWVRELQRYGGDDGVARCEAIFEADSDAVVALLDEARGDAGASLRWRMALQGLRSLLDDLGLDLDARLSLLDGARDAQAMALGADLETLRAVGRRYRDERRALEEALAPAPRDDDPLGRSAAVWRRRGVVVRAHAGPLRARYGDDEGAWRSLCASLAHMAMNRAFATAQNAHEMVLYDLLARIERGRRARGETL